MGRETEEQAPATSSNGQELFGEWTRSFGEREQFASSQKEESNKAQGQTGRVR